MLIFKSEGWVWKVIMYTAVYIHVTLCFSVVHRLSSDGHGMSTHQHSSRDPRGPRVSSPLPDNEPRVSPDVRHVHRSLAHVPIQ